MDYIGRGTRWHQRIDRQRQRRRNMIEASLIFLLVLMGVLTILVTL